MRARHALVLAAVTLFAAFGPPERTTPAKWALVVGISDYTNFGDELGGDLPGAANDARGVAEVLVQKYGFEPDNVKLVLDGAATRDRLQAELSEWLPSVARPGDLVWFYFAGHGSQAWDLDGDEEDGLDETVCPADVMKGNTERDILDDEVGEWLNALPTDNVIVVWDKCHAKSSTRAVVPFARPRSLDRKVKEDVAEPEQREAAPAQDQEMSTGSGILEIASAQADEVAIDAAFPNKNGGGVVHGGAFTTPFVQNLWAADENTTYEEIFTQTTQQMKRNRFRQQPDIDDKPLKDRPLFWTEAPTAPAVADASADAAAEEAVEAPVSGAVSIIALPEDSRAVLAGGFNADMTRGSIYRVGTDILEVTAVEPDHAEARVTTRETRGFQATAAGSLAVGAHAMLDAYRYPDAMLRVMMDNLPQAARTQLRQELISLPSLMLLDDETAFAHLIVQSRNGHYVVLNLDGFPRDSVEAPDAATGATALAPLLKREFGQFQLAELENPARPFEVDFKFGNGRTDFQLGEEVSFEITSERDGYLTLVDLAADGSAVVLAPSQLVPDNRLTAGRTKVVPGDGTVFRAVPPTGRGIIRAFVTDRPLVMPFSEGDASEAQRIWQALRNAAGRPAIQGSDAIPVQTWATAAIVYEIWQP